MTLFTMLPPNGRLRKVPFPQGRLVRSKALVWLRFIPLACLIKWLATTLSLAAFEVGEDPISYSNQCEYQNMPDERTPAPWTPA